MMPIDLAQLTTAFSGLQLIVIVFVLMELRALKEARKRDEQQNDNRDAAIQRLNARLSNVMGRLKLENGDD